MKQFTLKQKVQHTHDVYELVFDAGQDITMQPWQFVTFLIEKIWWRAYSILKIVWNHVHILLKKWELEHGGRGGSKYLCEMAIGNTLRWVGPSGHFVLSGQDNNKLFLWTGTGFVPLYSQIIWALEQGYTSKLKLVLWVRTLKDVFYKEELEAIQKAYTNFEFDIFLSQEHVQWFKNGYITHVLDTETVSVFDEYYLCGAPKMLDSTVEKLETLCVNKEKIFLEKY